MASSHGLRSPWGAIREGEILAHGAQTCSLGGAGAARAAANMLSPHVTSKHPSLLVTFLGLVFDDVSGEYFPSGQPCLGRTIFRHYCEAKPILSSV